MVRLLQRGLAARPGGAPAAPPPRGARVALATKRDTVAALVAQAGLAGLFAQAARIDAVAGEPLHQALLRARGPHDFATRWRRLERYVHATHAVRVVGSDTRSLQVEHAAADPQRSGQRPWPVESLAVAGVWVGALQAIGTQGLVLTIEGQRVFPGADEARLATLAAQGRAQHWLWRWTQVVPAHPPPSTMADELAAQLPWPDPATAVARRVLADPAGLPTLDALAQDLRQAPRSLQRSLAAQATGLRHIVGEVRVRMAAWWLLNSDHGLAEIGFLCGYTDQPHFTREFTRRAGAPPATWRCAAGGAG